MTLSTPAAARGAAFALGQMLSELFASASRDQALGFVRSVGARIASVHPLAADATDAPSLASAMNALWSDLGWGDVTLSLDATGILVQHERLPLTLPGDDAGHWRDALPTLLEGAYEHWFSALGGGAALHTRMLHATETAVEFRHGL